MDRREFLATVVAGATLTPLQAPLIVPVQLITDGWASLTHEQIRHFSNRIWPEAVQNLGWCGIRLQTAAVAGEVRRSPSGQPVFTGLIRGVLNLIVTDRIPMEWDNGRALSGVTVRYRGYHVCMIALNHAHCHQIPFLSVNTCVHELLHALLHDVFESRPTGIRGQAREFRIDLYATRLWLFRDGAAIREATRAYVERLQLS